MKQRYRHLTKDDRIVIKTLLQAGKTKQYIADAIGCNLSTIKRELRRNSGQCGYRYKQANKFALDRKTKPRTIKLTPYIIEYIESKLLKDYSPEQISETMQSDVKVKVSHESIYQHIWKDKNKGGDLYTHLRIAGGKKTRKRYGKKDWRGKIPNRVDIEKRPKIVESRRRYGDWEADLVCGKHHRGFLVTLVERKSRFTLIGHVVKKASESVADEIIRMLLAYKVLVHTITYDNGREFCAHSRINEHLACRSYFATPYHSWERGTNENTNGLIRQYFPKGKDLRDVTEEELAFVMKRLNSRPRKAINFKDPESVFLKAC